MKILSMCENVLDVCSFYRGYGVLSSLKKEENIEIKDVDYNFGFSWKELIDVDMVFIQRPYLPQLEGALNKIKECGVKMWFDYDDLMTDIPISNKYFKPQNEDFLKREESIKQKLYKKRAVAESFIKIIKYADVVTVSTQALKDHFDRYHDNVIVIKNAFNDYKFETNPEIANKGFKNIAWRGSDTHLPDMIAFQNTIRANALKHQGWTWHFMQYNPQFITDYLDQKRLKTYNPISIMKYFNNLPSFPADLFIVPLIDTDFNRCKSSNAAMEAAYAGCPAIVPNWPEWEWCHKDFRYNSIQEFDRILDRALKGELDLQEGAKHNWEYVKQNFKLSVINLQRIQLLKRELKL